MSDEKTEIHYHIYGDVVGRGRGVDIGTPLSDEEKAEREAERAREAAEEAAQEALEDAIEAQAVTTSGSQPVPLVNIYRNRSGGIDFNLGGGTLNVGGKIVAGDSHD